jgi:hypothetical protein
MSVRKIIKRGSELGGMTYLAPFENVNKKRQGVFKCRCGIEFVARVDKIRRGETQSCGCKTVVVKPELMESYRRGKHPLYKAWENMIDRCYRVDTCNYAEYGGRGVTVCDEWRESFKVFHDWAIIARYGLGKKLDNEMLGDGTFYSPATCCWLAIDEDHQYKKTARFCLLNGAMMSDSEASLALHYCSDYVSKIRCKTSKNNHENLILLY